MIRHVREALRQQNWLAYFIELIIVILGITIAYQLNLYQQERAIKQERRLLIENLQLENSSNIHELDTVMQHFISQPEKLSQLVRLLQSADAPADSVQDLLYLLYSWHYYTLNTGYLATYINGNVKVDDELTGELMTLQYNYNELKTAADLAERFRLDNIHNYLFDVIDITNHDEFRDRKVLSNVGLINRASILVGIENEHRYKYRMALEQAQTLDSMLTAKLAAY